jgi:putative transposase
MPDLGDNLGALLGYTACVKAKEGFFMSRDIPNRETSRTVSFRKITESFLTCKGLPFDKVLSEEKIVDIFSKHNNLFAANGIYSTAVVLWAFLGQALRDGKEASCQFAVSCIIDFCLLNNRAAPTQDTGVYCVAREKLSERALRELSGEVANELEAAAEATWLWKDFHPMLIDGFNFTMPDTPENQAAYPQSKSQEPGIGFPIARAVAIVSLATAAVMNVAIGPYAGKETGENALLRAMLSTLKPNNLAVMDRYYCSYMMLALLLNQGTHSCARKHHLRISDFRRGHRLSKHDHIVIWTRPQRPQWMSEELYAQIPETLELREVRFNIIVPGRRTHSLDIITTLIDADEYTKEDIAELYGFRWNAELDIRSIKSNLNLKHVRCKSPEMVRRELWTAILAYNLIRSTAASAATLHGKKPRQISFTSTCQFVLSSWSLIANGSVETSKLAEFILHKLKEIAACVVGNRPGRIEPRVIKRRRDNAYQLMRKPRAVLRAELRKQCT